MKAKVNLYDLWFYQGKYRTLEGLKRALIKDGTIWVSPTAYYYHCDAFSEYSWSYNDFKDYAEMSGQLTEDELKHFRRWLNKALKSGIVDCIYTAFYHCDDNDGIGEIDCWDVIDTLRVNSYPFDKRCPDDYIETAEESCEEYINTLTDEEFKEFEKLPDEKQMRLGMKWRIKVYNEVKMALEKK